MADEPMRRALIGGYDRDQVDAALRARDERLTELERQARQLAARVAEAERLAGTVEGDPPTIGALSRRLEEIQENARRRADRIRVSAQDAVQITERVGELSKLREELGAVVTELAGLAGIRVGGGGDRRAVGTGPARTAADGLYSGPVKVEVGPLRDFAQLTSFEDAAASIGAASDVHVSNFADGRATFSINFAQPVDLVRELERRTPVPFSVRSAGTDGIALDLNEGDQAA